MRIFNTQAEVDEALNKYGDLVIRDDVTFNCDVKIDGGIDAVNIDAYGNIVAESIDARGNIVAVNIDALNLSAKHVEYYAFCIAYESFKCVSVKGRRKNAIHKCLDGEIEFVEDQI